MGLVWNPDLEVIKCSHVGRTVVLSGEPHPHAISLLGRQLAEPWWPPLQLGSRWEEGVWGEGGEGQCLLWAPLSSYPRLPVSSRVKGQMIKQPCCSSKRELPWRKLWECENVQCKKWLGVQGVMQDDLAGKSKALYRETANVSLKFHFLCSSNKESVI